MDLTVRRPFRSAPGTPGRNGADGSSLGLSALLRPEIRLGRAHWPTWRLCVLAGIALGVTAAAGLAAASGRSPWLAGAVALAGVAVSALLALGHKLLTGHENYTFYHYQAAVLGATGLLGRIAGWPALANLDLIALALATAQACGRLGCLMAGCCHGRPHRRGIYYPPERYRPRGFTPHLLGVPLFPVQLVESAWLTLIALSCAWRLIGGAPAGETLVSVLIASAIGRFVLEWYRGDPVRRNYGPLSEAQWWSLAVLAAAAAGMAARLLPWQVWQIALIVAAYGFALASIVPAAARARRALGSAWHLAEVALATAPSARGPAAVSVTTTSLGYCISAEALPSEHLHHYGLSRCDGLLELEAARCLGETIMSLRHPSAHAELIRGRGGVFHLLVRTNWPG